MRWVKDICGCKIRKKGVGNRGSEWWNKEIKEVIRRKRLAFDEYLGNRSNEKWKEYRTRCMEIKRGVKEAKRRANERWGSRVEEYARVNNKNFWKEVNAVRKKREEGVGGIRNREGIVVQGAIEEGQVWSRYFKGLLNEARRGRAIVESDWDEELRGLV